MRYFTVIVVIFAAVTLVQSAGAGAENLLSNYGFDGNTTSWTDESDAYATAVYSTDDMNAQPGSGSVVVTSYSSSPTSEYQPLWQCAEVVEGQKYLLGGWVKIAGGQSETGHGGLTVYWTPNPDCSGWLAGGTAQSSAIGDWERTSELVVAPTGAISARVMLAVNKTETTGEFSVSVDDVFFIPVLFADGFESGDDSAWSDVVP